MKYAGNDNNGRPKSEYLDKLKAMNDAALEKEAEHKIWLSSFAASNPHSDHHWHVDAIYDECIMRNKLILYGRAHRNAFRQ